MMEVHGMHQDFVVCNKCGKIICENKTIKKADYVIIKKDWGYFSSKDGMHQEMNICEGCFDEMVKGFQIPPFEEANTELF